MLGVRFYNSGYYLMAWIKAFFSALVPTLPVAVVSGVCAAILCVPNLAMLSFTAGLFKGGLLHAGHAFIAALLLTSIPILYLAVKMTFIPNVIGVFIIIFSSHFKDYWLIRLSKRTLYVYGGFYGIIMCQIAVRKLPGDIFIGLALLPAAILSGIITFKLIVALLRYKFSADIATKPSVTDQA